MFGMWNAPAAVRLATVSVSVSISISVLLFTNFTHSFAQTSRVFRLRIRFFAFVSRLALRCFWKPVDLALWARIEDWPVCVSCKRTSANGAQLLLSRATASCRSRGQLRVAERRCSYVCISLLLPVRHFAKGDKMSNQRHVILQLEISCFFLYPVRCTHCKCIMACMNLHEL